MLRMRTLAFALMATLLIACSSSGGSKQPAKHTGSTPSRAPVLWIGPAPCGGTNQAHGGCSGVAGLVPDDRGPTAAPLEPPADSSPIPTASAEGSARVRSGRTSVRYIDGNLYVAAEVRNVGDVPVVVRGGPYTLLSGSGKVVAGGTFVWAIPRVIAPGRSAYLVDSQFSMQATPGLTLRFAPEVAVTAASTIPDLRVTAARVRGVSVDPGADVEVSGLLQNPGTHRATAPLIGVLLLDGRGRAFAGGVYAPSLPIIAPGQVVSFGSTSMMLRAAALLRAATTQVMVDDSIVQR
jgi:hypothetical protein